MPESELTCSLFLQPPLIPKVSHPGDTRYFDRYPEKKSKNPSPIDERDLALFKDF